MFLPLRCFIQKSFLTSYSVSRHSISCVHVYYFLFLEILYSLVQDNLWEISSRPFRNWHSPIFLMIKIYYVIIAPTYNAVLYFTTHFPIATIQIRLCDMSFCNSCKKNIPDCIYIEDASDKNNISKYPMTQSTLLSSKPHWNWSIVMTRYKINSSLCTYKIYALMKCTNFQLLQDALHFILKSEMIAIALDFSYRIKIW